MRKDWPWLRHCPTETATTLGKGIVNPPADLDNRASPLAPVGRAEANLPTPRPGDVIVIDADSHVIQGEPMRDREQLIWSLDLRPA